MVTLCFLVLRSSVPCYVISDLGHQLVAGVNGRLFCLLSLSHIPMYIVTTDAHNREEDTHP